MTRKKTVLAISGLFLSAIVVSACASTSTAATAAATQAPDVIDIGLAYSPQSKQDGLITPYKVI